MPLPGTRVIPPGWTAHHRPVANGTMTGTADVTRSGGAGTFDRDTAATTAAPRVDVALEQPVRVQRLDDGAAADVAGQDVTTARYLVTLPWPNAGLLVADEVALTACEDPTLVGHALTITEVMKGTLLFERDVIAIDNQG